MYKRQDVLYTALERHYKGKGDQIVQYNGLGGDLNLIKEIEMVDQNPIGRSSRSNPVTYIKAYDEIQMCIRDSVYIMLHITCEKMKGQIFFDLPLILNLFCKVCCVTENNNSIN